MSIDYLIARWQAVRTQLLATIAKFTEADLNFRPYPAAWTVRQLMLHLAQEEHGEFNYGLTQTLPDFPPEYYPDAYPDLGSIEALLSRVHAPNIEYLLSLADADLERVIQTPWGATFRLVEMVDHLIEHEIHHRAELSLILGMLGREGLNA